MSIRTHHSYSLMFVETCEWSTYVRGSSAISVKRSPAICFEGSVICCSSLIILPLRGSNPSVCFLQRIDTFRSPSELLSNFALRPAAMALAAGAPPVVAPPPLVTAALAAAASVGDAAADRVATLAQQRRDLVTERKRVSAELDLEKRKKKRIMEKAKLLSDGDLVAILGARAAAAKAKAKAKAKG